MRDLARFYIATAPVGAPMLLAFAGVIVAGFWSLMP